MTIPASSATRLAVVGGRSAPSGQQGTPAADPSGFSYIIADDHPSVRLAVGQMLSEFLGVAPSRVASADNSAALLEACAAPTPAPRVVVLDLVMPGELKRVALVRAVLAAAPALKVLVYTAEEGPFLARAVLTAGASGYVAKTSPAAEFVDAVAEVAKGQTYLDTHIDLDSMSRHPWATLTDSERAVILAFGRGSKASDIVEVTGRSYSTVMTHKYNGLTKLGLRDGSDLLPYIYVNGLLHELDGDAPAPIP